MLYENFDDGREMRKITSELRHEILKKYYWVHHDLLTKLVTNKLEQMDKCLIIDCHSFPPWKIEKEIKSF